MRRKARVTLAVASASLFAFSAQAEVKQASADSMLLAFAHRLDAAPDAVYAALGRVDQWWTDEHTYSGKAANLSLPLRAGGCYCEQWSGGSVEHGRVVLAMPAQYLRLDAPLGPLQGRAVNAKLTFELKPDGKGTALNVTYLVNGTAGSGLDKSAPAVDGVLGGAVARLVRYVETGRPAP